MCEIDAEEVRPGEFFCFQCAMLQTISVGGDKLKDKREKAAQREVEKRKKWNWGWFQYFLLSSSVLILTMWSVILFGQPEKAPSRIQQLAKNERVMLFLADSAVKRYVHYEKAGYPQTLMDLVPKYLAFEAEQLHYLDILEYERDPDVGYRLYLANPKSGAMRITLTAQGIEHEEPPEGD
jgi:hypothetical protein